MSSLLRERFISVNPSLIKTFGLLNAVVLQEIYFTTLTDQVGGGIGECDMSAAEIAGRIGVSKDQVYRAKKDLAQVGAITEIDKPGRSPKAQKSYSADVETIERLSADARIEMANLFAAARKGIRGSANRTPNIPTKEKKKKKKKTSRHEQGPLTEEPPTGQDEPDGSPDDAPPSEAIETANKAVEWFNTRRAEVLGEDKHRTSKASITAMDRLLRLGSPKTEKPQPVSKQELVEVCEWVFAHNFWASVIQSPQSLRDHWHKITSQKSLASNSKADRPLCDLAPWMVGRQVEAMLTAAIDANQTNWLPQLAERLQTTPGGQQVIDAIQQGTTPTKLRRQHEQRKAADYIAELVTRHRNQTGKTQAA